MIEAPGLEIMALWEFPVFASYWFISARQVRNPLNYLGYQSAIQQDPPIGSGEIESAHRYMIQERLKLPEAWWSPTHVETMLAPRLNRANREWEADWQTVEKEAGRPGDAAAASL